MWCGIAGGGVGGVRTSGRCSDSFCCVNGLFVLVLSFECVWFVVLGEALCRQSFHWRALLGFYYSRGRSLFELEFCGLGCCNVMILFASF